MTPDELNAIERIACAQERQVEQHDEQIERMNNNRAADLRRLSENRDDDITRIAKDHAEALAENARMVSVIGELKAIVLATHEAARAVAAVDPHAGVTTE